MSVPKPAPNKTETPVERTERAVQLLVTAAWSPRHTIQHMPYSPPRFEVIYAGRSPYPSTDPRAGALEATVVIEPNGALRPEIGDAA